MPHPNILTCRDVGLWRCDVANLLYNKSTSCRIDVSLSVCGVVQHMYVAVVRVVASLIRAAASTR